MERHAQQLCLPTPVHSLGTLMALTRTQLTSPWLAPQALASLHFEEIFFFGSSDGTLSNSRPLNHSLTGIS